MLDLYIITWSIQIRTIKVLSTNKYYKGFSRVSWKIPVGRNLSIV